jgi:peroxiredoxin
LLILALASFAFLANAEEKEPPKKKPEPKKEKSGKEKKGKKAPDFELADVAGKKHKLSDFKGKLVVLEWCNYSCPFVAKHYKKGHMQALQKKYRGKDVVWLAIVSTNPKHRDYRKPEKLKAMSTERKSNATAILMDADGKVGRKYKAKTTPHMFVIDKEGHIAYDGAIDSVRSADPADIADATNYVAAALDALMAGKKISKPNSTAYG